MSESCPKCGADRTQFEGQTSWECGSYQSVIGGSHVHNPQFKLIEGAHCKDRQKIAVLTQRAEQAERERDEAASKATQAIENCKKVLAATYEMEAKLTAAEAEVKRLREGIEALRDADHYDHWAVRLSDSELTALNTLFTLLAQPSDGKEAGDEPGK